MKDIYKQFSLQGRISLVTGASGHLGSAFAEALCQLGSEVIITDIDQRKLGALKERLQELYQVKVFCIEQDLEDPSAVKTISEQVKNKFDKLDVLVNNAAFGGSSNLEGWSTDFDNQSVETWRRALEVNLTVPFALTQACRSILDVSGKASVINIASIYGLIGPDLSLYDGTHMNNPAAYAASKGGLIQLTRWLSTVLAPRIRVNSISPGGIARGQPEEFVRRYVLKTPMQRMGTESDIIGALTYLASDSSNWVTGQDFPVDGGWTAW